ncbi:MAG: shikimate kinase [Clostridia bacterium]|nr:shikimate kinase [Clostridia bacterium]
MKNNIILIGMPGCGKSTVGVFLAKIIGYDFIDSDLLIQSREGKKLYEIIDEKGPDAFNRIENEVNASINVNNTVIATGGSVVYGKEAMEHLKSIGTVVYLYVTPEELNSRIDNFATRGISIREGQTFENLYEERSPLYEKYCDIKIDCTKASLSKNAVRIAEETGHIKKGL